ncbi:hypothetical protein [Paraburkholderia xenovorans]
MHNNDMWKIPDPSRGWRYPDHSTTLSGTAYQAAKSGADVGRDTGYGRTGHFINTNKTQMWILQSPAAHQMPWPFVQLEHETDIAARTAMWLNRPYAVIFDQLKWMNQYCPEPVPVSFADSLVEPAPGN